MAVAFLAISSGCGQAVSTRIADPRGTPTHPPPTEANLLPTIEVTTATVAPTETGFPAELTPNIELQQVASLSLNLVEGMAWADRDSKIAVIGDSDATSGIFLYDAETMALEWKAASPRLSVDINTNDGLLITSGEALQWRDVVSGELLGEVRGNAYQYAGVIANTSKVASGFWSDSGGDETGDPFQSYLFWFNIETRETLTAESWLSVSGLIRGIVSPPRGGYIAVVLAGTVPGSDDHVTILDVESWEPVCDLEGHVASFRPDGGQIAVADREGNLKLVDPATCEEVLVLEGLPNTSDPDLRQPLDLDYLGDGGALLVTSNRTELAQLWNLNTGEQLFTFEGFGLDAKPLVFDPMVLSQNGRFAALIADNPQGEGDLLQIWELSSP